MDGEGTWSDARQLDLFPQARDIFTQLQRRIRISKRLVELQWCAKTNPHAVATPRPDHIPIETTITWPQFVRAANRDRHYRHLQVARKDGSAFLEPFHRAVD